MPDIPTPKTDKGGDLERLTGQLGNLGSLLEAANHKIGDYLLQRESAAVLAKDSAAAPADTSSTAPSPPLPEELLLPVLKKIDIIEQQNIALYQALEQFTAQLEGSIRGLAEAALPHQQPQSAPRQPDGGGDWPRAILGPELAENADLAQPCRQLVSGVLAEAPDSQALAGQLLVFQSAPPERLPQLLKDLGEAFYRWEPKTAPESSAVEEALAGWVRRTCEAAGITNTIALVHPGERFDSTRHTATTRGVEIVQVHGWIVLRESGKVYTKAAVMVR